MSGQLSYTVDLTYPHVGRWRPIRARGLVPRGALPSRILMGTPQAGPLLVLLEGRVAVGGPQRAFLPFFFEARRCPPWYRPMREMMFRSVHDDGRCWLASGFGRGCR